MTSYPNSWLQGPISDKELTPVHDRPVSLKVDSSDSSSQ